MSRHMFSIALALAAWLPASGCAKADSAPAADPSTVTVRPLASCGITTLDVRGTAVAPEGNAKSCSFTLNGGRRLRLSLNRDDVSLMQPHLVPTEGTTRVYEGVGTVPGAHLYAAAVDVGGYTCSVNGFTSAEAAVQAAQDCSNVFVPASEGVAR